jgi:diacylglycerol kinase (ATP)
LPVKQTLNPALERDYSANRDQAATKRRDNRFMTQQVPPLAAASPADTEPANAQKHRKGLKRIRHAFGYSLNGLRAGWNETAFRQEALIAIVLIPAAFWLGRSWVETVLLAATVLLVMIVELLNTGIETAIDRIGPEWHELSKRAKDMGSAAVLLSLLLCSATWLAALVQRFWG